MMKFTTTFLLLASAHGWIPTKVAFSSRLSPLSLATKTSDQTHPCWQDIYDEDCSMDNAYAASFVASEWLKKMPCAAGIEDCDMPEDLKMPGNRVEDGAEEVDVMSFLNLKRASSVDSKTTKDGSDGKP